MKNKPISPKNHAIIDYVLAGSLLVLPSILGMNKKARILYAVEGLILLPYVALTKQPVALMGIIPLKMHKKIDPFNIAQFAFQSFLPALRRSKNGLLYNVLFTVIAGATVLLTDWEREN